MSLIAVHAVFILLPQFWCWIGNGSRYNAERLTGEYVWMWIALSVSLLMYIPLAWRGWVSKAALSALE